MIVTPQSGIPGVVDEALAGDDGAHGRLRMGAQQLGELADGRRLGRQLEHRARRAGLTRLAAAVLGEGGQALERAGDGADAPQREPRRGH